MRLRLLFEFCTEIGILIAGSGTDAPLSEIQAIVGIDGADGGVVGEIVVRGTCPTVNVITQRMVVAENSLASDVEFMMLAVWAAPVCLHGLLKEIQLSVVVAPRVAEITIHHIGIERFRLLMLAGC